MVDNLSFLSRSSYGITLTLSIMSKPGFSARRFCPVARAFILKSLQSIRFIPRNVVHNGITII